MDGHKADVEVEASKDSADIVLLKVRAGRSEEVSATIHVSGEGILFYIHAQGSHLCHSVNCSVQLASPVIHLALPSGVAVRDHLGEVVRGTLRALTDLPEEAPLGIKHWNKG